jgi:predicted TIM-barrel fold metal-dependent hydrolase
VDDLPKAAKDWPGLNFIMYHGALRPFLEDPATELALFEKTGYIRWATDLARMPKKYGVKNVYAELGTTFATCAVANPRFAACLVGQFVNEMGPDNVGWGSDSPVANRGHASAGVPDDVMQRWAGRQTRRCRRSRQA